MTQYDEMIQLAKKCGFTQAAPLNVSTLEFSPEVRDMCTACPSCGKSWACPPGCGTLDEMRDKVTKFSGGLLVQTVGAVEDSFDWDGIERIAIAHGKSYQKLRDGLLRFYPGLLAMNSGHCMQCKSCTYPENKPCRHPEKQTVSMSACGLFVSKVCSDNNLTYYHGPDTIAYIGCFLLE